jgi:endogenous inhibitor of DNA gyrase (YacG/DUF329 family)
VTVAVECPSCDREFDSERGRNIHHTTVHGESLVMEMATCDYCGDEYEVPAGAEGVYCSNDCQSAAMRDREIVECAACGEPFAIADWERDEGRQYCSQLCYGQSMRDRDDRRCAGCGRDYSVYDAAGITYCSRACMAEAKTTKPRPDDLDGTLWVLYVYEGHSARETWLRVNCIQPPTAEWLTKDDVVDRLRDNDWLVAGGTAKYGDLTLADVGLDDDPTPEGDETWEKYYKPGGGGADA